MWSLKNYIYDVVRIYNGILLNHKKEWNRVICRDVDGSRDCHIEWSKSEREKQISYINACMWNLEKWHRWTSLQGRNWDTDVENKRMDTKGGKWWRWGGGGVMNWEIGIDMYTLIWIKWITNKNLLYKTHCDKDLVRAHLWLFSSLEWIHRSTIAILKDGYIV